MTSAKIKHLAIVSDNYALEGRFYQSLFGMSSFPEARPDGAVAVTDGYVGLNVNPRRPGRQAGLDHFGFEVEDVDAVFARARERFPQCGYIHRPSNRPFAGTSMNDPAGNVFDLSKERPEDVYVAMGQQGVHARHVKHFAIRVLDPQSVARFYVEVIGLHEEPGREDGCVYLSDGHVQLIVAPWRIADYAGTGIERPAPDHIGFAVEDLATFQADVEQLSQRNPHLAARSIGVGREGEKRLSLLRACRFGEFQLADPDGVLLDVETASR